LAFLKVKSIPVPTKSGYRDKYFSKVPKNHSELFPML
jgi:hypothetical protein